MSRDIEPESGTYTNPPLHPHNGYYAGDFSNTPLPTLWSHRSCEESRTDGRTAVRF